MKLTPDFLKTVQPQPGKRLEFRDDEERGLVFRVTEKGSKSWSIRYCAATGEQRRKTYRYPETGLARARELARKLKGHVTEGRDVVGDERKAKAATERQKLERLDKLAEAYFAACLDGTQRIGKNVRKKAPRTLSEEKRVWSSDIEPKLGKRPVPELTKREIIQFTDALTARAPSAGRAAYTLLRQILNFAVTRDIIPLNPAPKVAVATIEPRTRWLRDDEIQKVWGLLNDIEARAEIQISDEMALLLQMMMVTPLRASEVAGMRWEEVDRPAALWTIPAPRMKGKRTHRMPISKPALGILERAQQMIGDDELVFRSPRTGKPLHVASIGAAFKRIVEHLKLPSATPHDFRRTATTNITSARIGKPRAIAKLLLAHADHDMTGRHYDMYAYGAEMRKTADAWAALLMRIVAGKGGSNNGKVIKLPVKRVG